MVATIPNITHIWSATEMSHEEMSSEDLKKLSRKDLINLLEVLRNQLKDEKKNNAELREECVSKDKTIAQQRREYLHVLNQGVTFCLCSTDMSRKELTSSKSPHGPPSLTGEDYTPEPGYESGGSGDGLDEYHPMGENSEILRDFRAHKNRPIA